MQKGNRYCSVRHARGVSNLGAARTFVCDLCCLRISPRSYLPHKKASPEIRLSRSHRASWFSFVMSADDLEQILVAHVRARGGACLMSELGGTSGWKQGAAEKLGCILLGMLGLQLFSQVMGFPVHHFWPSDCGSKMGTQNRSQGLKSAVFWWFNFDPHPSNGFSALHHPTLFTFIWGAEQKPRKYRSSLQSFLEERRHIFLVERRSKTVRLKDAVQTTRSLDELKTSRDGLMSSLSLAQRDSVVHWHQFFFPFFFFFVAAPLRMVFPKKGSLFFQGHRLTTEERRGKRRLLPTLWRTWHPVPPALATCRS